MATRAYDPVELARQFRFVREAKDASGQTKNTGQRVEGIQRWSGGQPGDSWCAEFATMMLDIAYQGNAPIPREGGCQQILAQAIEANWVVDAPQPGDLYLRVKSSAPPDGAHHVGFVAAIQPDANTFTQISGNTSADGKSSNGDGVYERDIPITDDIVFVRVPV